MIPPLRAKRGNVRFMRREFVFDGLGLHLKLSDPRHAPVEAELRAAGARWLERRKAELAAVHTPRVP